MLTAGSARLNVMVDKVSLRPVQSTLGDSHLHCFYLCLSCVISFFSQTLQEYRMTKKRNNKSTSVKIITSRVDTFFLIPTVLDKKAFFVS